jgi:N-acetylmuramoyl-L-alanine amidase
MIEIKNHFLVPKSGVPGITADESPNHSGTFSNELPDTIVIHYTAGNSLASSVSWLKNPQAKASAHTVVGKTGDIVQLVPFNIKAWHAGRSHWKGRSGMNHYSIGIEIDNAGLLEKRADGYYTHFSKRIDNSQVVLARHKNGTEEQAWEAFTEKQIEAVELICLSIKEQYPIIDIVGHDDISPGRKIDPGPAFPLESLRNRVLFGRKDDQQDDQITEPETSAGVVSADYLNIRQQAAPDSPLVSDPLPKGTKLRILENDNGWLHVKVDMEGWVSQRWVKKI